MNNHFLSRKSPKQNKFILLLMLIFLFLLPKHKFVPLWTWHTEYMFKNSWSYINIILKGSLLNIIFNTIHIKLLDFSWIIAFILSKSSFHYFYFLWSTSCAVMFLINELEPNLYQTIPWRLYYNKFKLKYLSTYKYQVIICNQMNI